MASTLFAGNRPHADAGGVFTCAQCGYFRAVLLPSGHKRTFCTFTGEKVRPEHPACSFRLTSCGLPAMLKAPNNTRRNKRLFGFPRAGKSLVAYSARLAAGVFIGWLVHIGRVQRPGSREAPAVSC